MSSRIRDRKWLATCHATYRRWSPPAVTDGDRCTAGYTLWGGSSDRGQMWPPHLIHSPARAAMHLMTVIIRSYHPLGWRGAVAGMTPTSFLHATPSPDGSRLVAVIGLQSRSLLPASQAPRRSRRCEASPRAEASPKTLPSEGGNLTYRQSIGRNRVPPTFVAPSRRAFADKVQFLAKLPLTRNLIDETRPIPLCRPCGGSRASAGPSASRAWATISS
jgi:hypothetical protein